MGNDFKTAPLSTFDIVYVKVSEIVLFQQKCPFGEKKIDSTLCVEYDNSTFPGESYPAIISGWFSQVFRSWFAVRFFDD